MADLLHRFLYSNMLDTATLTARTTAGGVVTGNVPLVANGSGSVIFSGTFTGDDFSVYAIEIDLAGDVGTATFKWRKTETAAGLFEASGVVTSASNIALDNGVNVRFVIGAGTDFELGDRWQTTANRFRSVPSLIDRDPKTTYRSDSPPIDPEFVTADLGSAQAPDAAILHGHNISSGATVKVQAGPVPQDFSIDLNPSGNDDAVRVDDVAAIQNIFDATAAFEAWVQIRSDTGASANHRIFDKGNWALRFKQGTASASKVQFVYVFSTTNGVWITDDAIIAHDRWYKIRVEYDSNLVANNPTFIVTDDAGVETTYTVGSGITETTAPAGTRLSDAGENLFLGNDKNLNDANSKLDGLIDEFTVESPIGTTLIHIPFDEGAGTAADDSGGGHDGTLVNGAAWSTSVHSPLSETLTWRAETMIRYLTTSPRSYRYWRLLVEGDAGNADGYIEIAEIFLGGYFEPSRYWDVGGAAIGDSPFMDIRRTDDARLSVTMLDRARMISLPYIHRKPSDVVDFQTMINAIWERDTREFLPFFFHLDTTDNATLFLMALTGEFMPVVNRSALYDFVLQMEEQR